MSQKTKIAIAIFSSLLITALIVFVVYQTGSKKNKQAENTTESDRLAQLVDYKETAEESATESQNSTSAEVGNTTSEDLINISKINISAPISVNVDGNNMETYMKALENGVAHLAKTALPGEVGNTVIFGHSSYYRAKPGNFKTIFARLYQLSAGDTISVSYGGKSFNYLVDEIIKVAPEEIAVVEQNQEQHKLTLITCWPPKTTESRLVVVAYLEQ